MSEQHSYREFIERKSQDTSEDGFAPVWLPDFLFHFQRELVEWALRKGRGALFEGCGLGKSPQSLVWAENVVRKTAGRVLIGSSSEALGGLGFMDMLNTFFKNARNNSSMNRAWQMAGGGAPQWRFRGHAEKPFWRWVCSWARALEKPSDIGYPDGAFALPPLIEREHVVKAQRPREGMLFSVPAVGLAEEREERRRTMTERCEMVASLVSGTGKPAVCWGSLNDECDLVESLVKDSVQVSGRDSDDEKEEKYEAFTSGQARVLVVKPVLASWGLNWQHCAHMTAFGSHSFEMHYQSVRRFWRFGQTQPVIVDHVLSDGEQRVLANLRRKTEQATKLFRELASNIEQELHIQRGRAYDREEQVPSWL